MTSNKHIAKSIQKRQVSKGVGPDIFEAKPHCPCSGVTLDRLIQPAILIVLSQKCLHGYGIGKALAEMRMFHERQPDMTGLYRTLKDMQRRGLIESSFVRSGKGPRARVFQTAAPGLVCLKRWVCSLNDYRDGLNDLLLRARRSGHRSG
jgi:DNA-binding PadR family transcriptional regulator